MSEQPFIPAIGGDVQASGGTYIRRPADDQLLQACLNNQFAYVLASRQIGKSSLKNAVAEHLIARGVRVARIDLNRIGREEVTPETWYFGLLDEIARTLELDIDVDEWWDKQPSFSPLAQRFVHFFDEIVLTKIQQPIVVFIDEIDVTLDLPFTNDLFAIIRSFHNDRAQNPSYRRLTFVLLGVASPDELINDPKRTPFNIGKAIEMRDFQWEECEPLRLFIESKHPGRGENYFKKIHKWTKGHPYLTQKLCVATSKTDTVDNPNLIDDLVNEIFFKEGERIEENLHFVQTRVLQDKYTRQMLQTYAKILRHHTVLDDKKSPAINRLSLYGLVVAENGILRVRNKIYERAFDYEWYRKNHPRNWNQIVIVILGLIVAFFLGINLYNFKVNQDATAIIDNFQKQSAKIQIESLATLLSLKHLNLQFFNHSTKDFANEAQSLFFSLSSTQQAELFKVDPPDAKIILVIQGIYTTLADANTPGNSTWLLQAMIDALDKLPETPEKNMLSEEIKSWVVGRNSSKQGQDKQALDAYNNAIALNGANESTRYERARVLFKLTQPEKALTDLNQIIAALKQSGAPTPIAFAATLTITPTATFTPLPTLTSTPIIQTEVPSTPTLKVATPISSVTSTSTKVEQISTPITTPSIPTSTPTPDVVISEFSRSDQIIGAVRNLINNYRSSINLAINSKQQVYPNLVEYSLVPTPIAIALASTSTPTLSTTIVLTPNLLSLLYPLKENALGIWAAELQKLYNPTGNTSDNNAAMNKNDIPEGIACDVFAISDGALKEKKDEIWQLVCSNNDFKTTVPIQVNGTAARGLTGDAYYTQKNFFTVYGSGRWPDAAYDMTPPCTKVTEVQVGECEVLVTLYKSTNGPNWITKTNWLVTNTPCTWYGITCSGNSITEIRLSQNRLVGSIPVELGTLLNLSVLSLYGNQLRGSIPPELGNLSNLTVLALQVNQLDGRIPNELSKLSRLKQLHLGQNHLTGGIPPELGKLQALQYLKLGDSGALGGSIPSELGNLKQLILLELTNTSLNGPIPPTLGNLSSLRGLSLQNNQLSGLIPEELGQLTQLQCLQLNNNQLTGNISVSLTQLVNLKGQGECPFGGNGLNLSNNALTATDPTLLAFLDQKAPGWEKTQTIFDCTTVQGIPSNECSALVALYNTTGGATTWYTKTNWLVTNMPCSAEGRWYGVTCANGHVTTLNLRFNGLNGELPSDLGNLTELVSVDLASDYNKSSKLSGPLPDALRAWKKLQSLNLGYNSISGDLPEWLGELSSLKVLDLSFTSLTGQIPHSLSNLENLTFLSLNFTQISGTIPSELGQLKNLTLLYLASPNLTGEIPETIGNLTELRQLILRTDQQRLTGSLSWLPKLTKLNFLGIVGFDGSTASGTILSDIATLKALQLLILHNDQLSGSIPDILGEELTQLECLDLGENRLTGSIPLSFMKLTNLKDDKGCNQVSFADSGLNLNHNELTIPDNQQLRDFLNRKAPGWEQTQRNPILIFTDNFEENPIQWEADSVTAALVSPGYNSQSAVQVHGDSGANAIHRFIPGDFKTGNSYRASVWCKAEARTRCDLFFGDLPSTNNPGYENSSDELLAGNGQWQLLSVCKTLAKDETGTMSVHLYAKIYNSQVLYDNLQIEQVSRCAMPTSPSTTSIRTFDFEKDLQGWENCYSTSSAQLVLGGHDSEHAVQVSYIDEKHGAICHYFDDSKDHVINVKAGESYRVSGWCKANLGVICTLGFTNLPYNDDGNDNVAQARIRGNNDWQLFSTCRAMVKDARMSVHLYADDTHTSEKVLYDDLQVVKVSSCP